MSRSVLTSQTASPARAEARSPSRVLRINKPGDDHELEADRIADSVVRGERIAGWGLKGVSIGVVQRQTVPDAQGSPQPKPLSTGDMVGKVAEAVLATKEGKAAVEAIKKDKLVKSTTDFIQTPAGIVITGAAAVGVVSGLAAAHQPLPLQVPRIPLDFIHPGLGVKFDYHGPVDHPTSAMITLSFTPKGPEKKEKKDEAAAYRAETAAMAERLQVFSPQQTDASQLGPVAQPKQGMSFAEQWALSHTPDYAKFAPPASATTQAPDVITGADPAAMKWKPAPDEAKAKSTDEKREEPVIQRKAETSLDEEVNSSDVEEVIGSQGRPLDAATRRFMESRIGFDFSKVRIFTGDQAAASARSLKARAYTVGSNVVFGSGTYAPQTAAGQKLLAHELSHVVQQSGSTARKAEGIPSVSPETPRKISNARSANLAATPASVLRIGPTRDAYEREADRAAESISRNRPLSWSLSRIASPGAARCLLQRQTQQPGTQPSPTPGFTVNPGEYLKMVNSALAQMQGRLVEAQTLAPTIKPMLEALVPHAVWQDAQGKKQGGGPVQQTFPGTPPVNVHLTLVIDDAATPDKAGEFEPGGPQNGTIRVFVKKAATPSDLAEVLFHEALHAAVWLSRRSAAPDFAQGNKPQTTALRRAHNPIEVQLVRNALDNVASVINPKRQAKGQTALAPADLDRVAHFLVEEALVYAETFVFETFRDRQTGVSTGPVTQGQTGQPMHSSVVNLAMVDKYLFDFSKIFLPSDRALLAPSDQQVIADLSQILENFYNRQVKQRTAAPLPMTVPREQVNLPQRQLNP